MKVDKAAVLRLNPAAAHKIESVFTVLEVIHVLTGLIRECSNVTKMDNAVLANFTTTWTSGHSSFLVL